MFVHSMLARNHRCHGSFLESMYFLNPLIYLATYTLRGQAYDALHILNVIAEPVLATKLTHCSFTYIL